MLAIACTVENNDDPFAIDTGGTDAATDSASASVSASMTASDTSPTSADGTVSVTGQTATATEGDTEEVGECGPAKTCVTSPPEGWFGPVAIALGETGSTTECGEGYPESGLTLLSGYHEPGPANCSCECMLNGASSCTSYMYLYDNACSQFQNFLQFTMDCHPFVVNGGAYFSSYAQGNGFCQGMVTEDLPEPQWDAQITTCKAEDLGASCGDDGVCMPIAPEGFEDSLCIYMEGENECPAGDFSEQFIHYSGVDDTRNCSSCQCGMAAATCMGTMEVYAADDCTGEPIAETAVNACTMNVSGGNSVAIDYGGDSVCPVMTPPEAVGTIATTGAFTYCCTP